MTEALPYRLRVYACIHPETYKYYLDRASVWPTWEALERAFGPIARNAAFGTMEILTRALIIRSTTLGDVVGFAVNDELTSNA